MTKQFLDDRGAIGNAQYLAEIWNNTVRSLSDFSPESGNAETSPEVELLKAAEMIGCRVNFTGIRPPGRKTALLFYTAVREALTNAVTHGNSDMLYVDSRPNDNGYRVEISDNGTARLPRIKEGNGLGNLRTRLEREGATLMIRSDRGVRLIIELPAET
jgi:signal transduction histidine kinase